MGDRVQAVERALALLEEVAASPAPVSASELAARAGINRATAWRLLATLEHFDLVRREDGRYRVSYGAVRLAAATDAAMLTRRARPVLERLASSTGGSAFLEVATGGQLVVLDEARPSSPLQVDLSGLQVPWHCGSVGKLFLASWPADELDAFLAVPLERLTPETVTDPGQLRREVDRARHEAVAVNYREHQEDWCGITSAVRDRAGRDLAYLNLTLPTHRWTREQLLDLMPVMVASAREVEAALAVTTEPVELPDAG